MSLPFRGRDCASGSASGGREGFSVNIISLDMGRNKAGSVSVPAVRAGGATEKLPYILNAAALLVLRNPTSGARGGNEFVGSRPVASPVLLRRRPSRFTLIIQANIAEALSYGTSHCRRLRSQGPQPVRAGHDGRSAGPGDRRRDD